LGGVGGVWGGGGGVGGMQGYPFAVLLDIFWNR